MEKVITLTDAEYYALISYFDETTINISSIIKKRGLKHSRDFESALDKIYDVERNKTENIHYT